MTAPRLTVLFTAALALAGAAILRVFPPARYTFYPRCPIYAATHLLCPGCGATRALAALLQGHLAPALRSNALAILLLPALLAYALLAARRAWSPGSGRWPQPPAWAIAGLLTATLLFTVARNLPAHTAP